MKYNNIAETIGNTPVINITHLFPKAQDKKIVVWAKLERSNPGGSIKDRIAKEMIEAAEREGKLKPGSIIVEPTSGNTGIALAMIAATRGYKLILTMPESMSLERRKLMAIYGAELVLTPREKGMKGAIEKAQEILKENKDSWMPSQFENENNVVAHEKNTAQEILKDFPEGLDYLVSGVGTGGHLTGCSKVLKEKFSKLQTIAIEPKDSPVLSGGAPGPHPIQGIGAGFIPSILKTNLIDHIYQITKEEAFLYAQKAAREAGLLVGVSSGANLAGVSKLIDQAQEGSVILTFSYDTGERYLSVEGLF